MTKPNYTVVREDIGQFRVMRNGRPTGFGVVNGSLGMSGRERNFYCVTRFTAPHFPIWVGTLANAKKLAIQAAAKHFGEEA